MGPRPQRVKTIGTQFAIPSDIWILACAYLRETITRIASIRCRQRGRYLQRQAPDDFRCTLLVMFFCDHFRLFFGIRSFPPPPSGRCELVPGPPHGVHTGRSLCTTSRAVAAPPRPARRSGAWGSPPRCGSSRGSAGRRRRRSPGCRSRPPG